MSANSALVNAHINRVLDDGGDISTIDIPWLQAAYQWLVDNGLETSLLHWADPAFGVLKSGSNITRIYDLGSTYLPRSLDLTPRDSTKTTYSATGLNSSFPAFVNSDGSSQLYWGRGNRYAQIRRKQQLTIAAIYERTQTSSNIALVGAATTATDGTSFGISGIPKFGSAALIPGLSLVHTSGTPGTIQFKLTDKSLSATTASVTASGATTQVAIGTYDGTTMTAYSDGTGGTGQTGLFRDPYFAGEQSLSGPRAQGSSSGMPFLSVGDTKPYATLASPNNPPFTTFPSAAATYTNAYAQFKGGSIIVLGVGLTLTQAASLTALLQNHGISSVDIKADYGATGDGQKVTAVFSIASGTKNLSCTTNQWVSGDGGGTKYIAITGAGVAGATLRSKIDTFTDAQHIVIHDNASTTLSSSTQTVEWGHDDSPAFVDFKADFQGQSNVTLTIPAGRYLFVTDNSGALGGSGIGFTHGITDLQVTGTGNPVLSDLLAMGSGYFMGGSSGTFENDTSHSARLVTLNAGATTATLVSSGDATIFSGVTWGMIGGWDMQDDQQYPMNHFTYEYIPITSVVGSTVNFGSTVQKSYKSTWPIYDSVAHTLDNGGPATLYAVKDGWDCTHTYTGLVFDQVESQVNSNGRNITFTDCTALNLGINISATQSWTGNNLDCSDASNEIDKLITNLTITGGTWHAITMQSSSVDVLTMTNVHVTTSFNGTAKSTVMSGCTIDPSIIVGPYAYGSANEFRATSCVFTGGFSTGGFSVSDIAGTGAYTMTGGVISRLKASGDALPPAWANPNGWVYWAGTDGASAPFKVLDSTQSGSGGNTFNIVTNKTGFFPTNIPGTLGVRTHPAPIFRLISCTGSDAAIAFSAASSDRPMNSYWQRTYTTSGAKSEIQVIGKVVSITFNVTSAFSAGATFSFPFGAFVHNMSSNGRPNWNPSIDLATTGLRTITQAGANSRGADSGLTLPSDAIGIWLVLGQLVPTITGSGGSVTVEFITDQGFETVVVAVLMPMGCM